MFTAGLVGGVGGSRDVPEDVHISRPTHLCHLTVLNGRRPGNEASNFLSLVLVQAYIVEYTTYLWCRECFCCLVPGLISSLHEKRPGYDAGVIKIHLKTLDTHTVNTSMTQPRRKLLG